MMCIILKLISVKTLAFSSFLARFDYTKFRFLFDITEQIVDLFLDTKKVSYELFTKCFIRW